MKIKNFAVIASILLASLSAANAATSVATTLTAWTFDNLSTGANISPSPSAGFGTASAINLTNSPTSDILSLAGSSSGGANAWEVTGGWSTSKAVGTQGAQFAASTAGFYQIQVSFDVYATTNAEADLQVQYTTDGSYWKNATITSAGTSGLIGNNTITTNSLVVGSYVILTNNGTAAWNNQVTVNLTGISGVDNDPNFAIRIVNASTGTNCLDTTGAAYNNAGGGDWTFDNVVVSGVSFDTVASWPFDNVGVISPINNPVPAISNNTATATCIGFGTPSSPLVSSTFGTGAKGSSTNAADILANGAPFSSTGSSGQDVWRLRGLGGNGWLSTQPIGSQGAEFDVSTANYTNILVTFDLYFTSQGEAKMCVLYTTNNWTTTNVANNYACSTFPTLILTNTTSPNTVVGTYFFNSVGSQFYNYMSVDFTGIPNVANNSQFGFRIVNASKNGDCVNAINQAYNNNSGNCRLDNVSVNGQFFGTISPTLTNQTSATVDAPFTNTFSDSTGWFTNISSIYVNGVKLTNTAYVVTASNITYTPSTNAPVLTVAGFDNIVIYATNYTTAKITQFIGTGVATKLAFIQPAGPSASSGTLIANPSFAVTDQYGNGTTNPYNAMVVTASVSNSPATWTLGGSTVQPIINGSCTFTDLTATVIGTSAITNAVIHFAIAGYTPLTATNSTSFTIGAPATTFTQGNLAAIQIDTTGNNTTFSIVELKPSAAGQTKPVNIIPISATGTNALRLSGSGSCGHLSLSDDGTFLVFAAFDDGSSATPDETFNLNRAVGTLDYTNGFKKTGKYVSDSFGGSQARSACSPDNTDFLIDDKGGLYVYNHNNSISANVYEQNNYCTRSFGGAAWVLSQKVVAGLPSPSVFQFNNGNVAQLDYINDGNDAVYNTASATPPPDGNVVDFYMISTNGSSDPASFGILYTLDQNLGAGGTNGVIFKWAAIGDGFGGVAWTNIGAWTNIDNGATLFATTNGSGGVYLYYANGGGGTAKNSLIRVTDQSITNNLNIISTNTIYTAPSGTSIEGVTFVPVPVLTPYTNAPTPPPVLTAQTVAYLAGATFAITNTLDDSYWHSNITTIAVNGTVLTGGYNTNVVGAIVFTNASTVGLVQGSNNIVISAAVYSTNSVVQYLIGADSQLVMKTEPSGTNSAGGTLSTEPALFIEDSSGDVDAANNSTVVAAIVGTGTGPLTGTTTATAANGVVTFSSLKAPTLVQTGLKLTFTNSVLPNLVDNTSIKIIAAAPNKLGITTQPTAPAADGGVLTVQPVVAVQDQYGNVVTTATSNIVAQVGAGSWTIGGTTTKAAVSGTATFTGLTAFSSIATSGDSISFTSSGLTGATSSPFNISAPILSNLGGVTLTGGKLKFSFTNATGLGFSILATNNISAPMASWPVIGTATESPAGSGNYQFTNSTPATNAGLFYILRQP